MNLKSNLLLFFVLISLISCDEKRIFDEYRATGGSWKKDNIIQFDFEEKDTTKVYNLFINIRNNNDYPFNNLFVIVALKRPDGFVKRDTLQYEMTYPDGTLLGDGFSDVKESKLFYKQNFRFSKPGKYKIQIQQANRQTGKVTGVEELLGVTEVGFRIESTE